MVADDDEDDWTLEMLIPKKKSLGTAESRALGLLDRLERRDDLKKAEMMKAEALTKADNKRKAAAEKAAKEKAVTPEKALAPEKRRRLICKTTC